MPPLIQQAFTHPPSSPIIRDATGSHTCADLLATSAAWAELLLNDAADLSERRVAFLVPPSFTHVAVQWGIWRAGGVAVSLCMSHPAEELAYVIEDCEADIVVAHPDFDAVLRGLADRFGARFISTADFAGSGSECRLPDVAPDRNALIIYTSGTTSRPKGAVSSHAIIAAQIESLVIAWGWTAADRITLVLPLHHIHGIINIVGCALWVGARCELMSGFDAKEVWHRLRNGELTLFMAVPTIYTRLIADWDASDADEKSARSAGCRRLRLMVSGSAALPVKVFERWREISGHDLLERYGMTEIGMALSNPLKGTRRPGHVGAALPGVEIRLIDDSGATIPESAGPDQSGEIQVRGPGIFRAYWGKPEATASAFTDDGWFRTGDIAVRDQRSYRILGRSSVDIIKTGGFKVSALEIEEVLNQHPAIDQCAVVGLPDDEWGERVAIAVVPAADQFIDLPSLRSWAKKRIAVYKIPSVLCTVTALPRNAMGKVVKPEVASAILMK